jgi:catechol 2,3-dioxygenase-like lactoylglutathione lyase family enzyme
MDLDPTPSTQDVTFFGLTHLDVPVSDLTRAKRLYGQILGFAVRSEGDGWVDLDTGTTTLRLVATARPESRVAIRVQSPTVEAAFEHLVRSGTQPVSPPTRTPDQRLIGSVRDPDGHTIHVWRPLTEDEYGFLPDLPTEMSWHPDAEKLLKSLLLSVPALFRGLARRRVVLVAEELAERSKLVTKEDVIRSFILSSPRITRGRNRRPLVEHGIDVDRYSDDWNAPLGRWGPVDKRPVRSRSASNMGSRARAIAWVAAATSYGTRSNRAVRAARSITTKLDQGLPSRGCPTEPGLTSTALAAAGHSTTVVTVGSRVTSPSIQPIIGMWVCAHSPTPQAQRSRSDSRLRARTLLVT